MLHHQGGGFAQQQQLSQRHRQHHRQHQQQMLAGRRTTTVAAHVVSSSSQGSRLQKHSNSLRRQLVVARNSVTVPTMPIPGNDLACANKRGLSKHSAGRPETQHPYVCLKTTCTGADDLLICPENRAKLQAR